MGAGAETGTRDIDGDEDVNNAVVEEDARTLHINLASRRINREKHVVPWDELEMDFSCMVKRIRGRVETGIRE